MPPTESESQAAERAQFVAMAAVARWEKIDGVLTPLLGRRGMAALYRRTLNVAGSSHPCLIEAHESEESVSFKHLRRVLARQSPDAAAAATDASLETFHQLLDSLIGTSLTQRLLGSVWSPIFSGSPAQDSNT
ncbi:hypothetical protein [Acidovorax sp. NCPPB 3576]|uniref:hypothetical protein n=1 Tax=Acidovorax sp. NCPPB 3576 TaxID=2940488 RepID=UPI002349ADF3|nr:hypothetical protein [Acidovorax sp. NCPPB 3576]WCM90672.1 hypothetical protein M5C98_11930 [Acidovorax sp. NCPPB 3576]